MSIFTIPIVFSSDNNYVQHLCGAIASVLVNKDNNTLPEIYIIDGGISPKNKKRIESLKKIKNFKIQYLSIEKSLFENLPIPERCKQITISSYYRFLIAELLPQYDKVIYLDADLNVLADLKEFYNTELNDNYIAGAVDIVEDENKKRLSLKKYINAGVMLLNLKKIREDNIQKLLFEYGEKYYDKILWVDQDVINVVMQEGIKCVDECWNVQMPTFRNNSSEEIDNIKIIHYIGSGKPWNSKTKKRYEHIYWKYLNYTPFWYKNLLFDIGRLKKNLFSVKYSKNKKHKIIKILFIKIKLRQKQ